MALSSCALVLAACTRTVVQTVGPRIPPPPSSSSGPSGEPPLVWVGGALQQLGPGRLAVKETSGTVVSVERLGAGATAFFRVSGGRWRQSTAPPSAGGMPVCVEAAVAGSRYLALRVFLGAPCGPD